jgi:WD40 repeat protein
MTETRTTKKQNLASATLNPYPGLRPFKIEESHLFFGREGQTDEVLQKLSDNRFVGIIGPSGSGKSSFVYCGVLPILFGGFLTDTGPNWDVIVLRPGSSPMENLAQALLEKDPSYKGEPEEDYALRQTILATLLRSNSDGLVEVIKKITKATNLNYLILVDQFEEIFRYKTSSEDKHSVDETMTFINLLMDTVNHEDKAYYVSITMRSDFIGDCAQYAELTRKINDSNYLIPQLTREQKRAAIEGPASVAHGKVSQRLVQRLLNDLGDNPDQLPILQHALMRTWDFWTKNREGNENVDLKHYEAIGTMSEALSLHADEALSDLNEKQKHIVEVMFRALTEKRGLFGIRRPTKLREIAAIADCTNKELADVIIVFRKPGRSFLTPPHGVKLTPDSMIDISHESLMRIWVRLKNWVDDEADAVGIYLRLAEASEMFQVGKAGLWRPPDLQLALNWQIKHKPTLVWGQRYDPAFERALSFLEYSKKEYDNEQRIRELQAKRRLRTAKITAIVLASATLISVGFLVYALLQKTVADQQRFEALENLAEAQRQTKIADSASTEALYQAKAATDSAESARLARIDALIQRDSARIAQDSAEVARGRAEIAQKLAVQRQLEAEEAQRAADEANREAQVQRASAIANADTARIRRYIAIAKGLGVKATQNIPDPQLRGLMAKQAYNYNVFFSGNSYDADIFAGLYSALSEVGFNDPSTQSLTGHRKEVYTMESSTAANAIFTAGTQGRILKWTINDEGQLNSSIVASTRGGTAEINSIEVSADGGLLVAAGRFTSDPTDPQTYLEVYNLSNNSVRNIEGIIERATVVELVNNDQSIIYLDSDGKNLNRIGINGQGKTLLVESQIEIRDISISADGSRIAGARVDGKVVIWEASSGSEIEIIQSMAEVPAAIQSVEFSKDGRFLAYGDEFGTIVLMDANQYTGIASFTDQIGVISDIDFNYEAQFGLSTFIAASSYDNTTRIWNLDEARRNDPPITYTGNHLQFSVCFSPDNQMLLSGSERGELKVYPTHAELMADKLCGYINRNMTSQEWEAYVGTDIKQEDTCPSIASSND